MNEYVELHNSMTKKSQKLKYNVMNEIKKHKKNNPVKVKHFIGYLFYNGALCYRFYL